MDNIIEAKFKTISRFLQKEYGTPNFTEPYFEKIAWKLLKELEQVECDEFQYDLQQEYFAECARAYNV